MQSRWIAIILFFITLNQYAYAKETTIDFDKKVQQQFTQHYNKYKDLEYFSGAALSIYIPNQPIKNYYVGYQSHDKNKPISETTLFEIGSITKSFTAAIVLQLEKENKLTLNDTLGQWLPEYSKWSSTTIQQLLDMSSGLPNYSEAPLWNAQEYKNPSYQWKNSELINFVYPSESFQPPLKNTYFYSNTGYILSAMIVEKASNMSYTDLLQSRIIHPEHLDNTFYPMDTMNNEIKSRLASGYSFNQYDNPEWLGKDVNSVNLSWAGAAGGMVSNTEDIIKWVKALFLTNDILDPSQKEKLEKLISTKTGKPITITSPIDPRGFGLGVVQSYDDKIGRFWLYEGETLGFRALYMYVPCSGVIISSIYNSATNSENDHAGELMTSIYKFALKNIKPKHC
jgi:D-alanyl-D-alanine carboxypeptidase